eukprot:500161_1
MSSLPPFLLHLWAMIEDPLTNDIITWSHEYANAFVINDVKQFEPIIARYFKHKKFASFVRQLNMYEFYKIRDSRASTWGHQYLRQGEKHMLANIHRKTTHEADARSAGKGKSNAMDLELKGQEQRVRTLEHELTLAKNVQNKVQKQLTDMQNMMDRMASCLEFLMYGKKGGPTSSLHNFIRLGDQSGSDKPSDCRSMIKFNPQIRGAPSELTEPIIHGSIHNFDSLRSTFSDQNLPEPLIRPNLSEPIRMQFPTSPLKIESASHSSTSDSSFDIIPPPPPVMNGAPDNAFLPPFDVESRSPRFTGHMPPPSPSPSHINLPVPINLPVLPMNQDPLAMPRLTSPRLSIGSEMLQSDNYTNWNSTEYQSFNDNRVDSPMNMDSMSLEDTPMETHNDVSRFQKDQSFSPFDMPLSSEMDMSVGSRMDGIPNQNRMEIPLSSHTNNSQLASDHPRFSPSPPDQWNNGVATNQIFSNTSHESFSLPQAPSQFSADSIPPPPSSNEDNFRSIQVSSDQDQGSVKQAELLVMQMIQLLNEMYRAKGISRIVPQEFAGFGCWFTNFAQATTQTTSQTHEPFGILLFGMKE